MKSTSVRGTPVTSIKASNTEGQRAGKPAGMNGTVNKQFEGDQRFQENPRAGTPYNSQDGNGPETRVVRSQGKYGMVTDENGDQNNPKDNGNGVLLDGISREAGYTPRDERTMDSPVHEGAPRFNTSFIKQENLAHLGQGIGAAPSQASDEILAIGGVMSRGMVGTSRLGAPEGELTEDDTLRATGNTTQK